MDIRKLQRAIVDGLEDVKAQHIRVFNTEHLSPLFERVVVASGTSNRQTKALAASVRDSVKDAGFAVLRTEGEDNGEWIIVDCGAAVVHIMQPTIREYYHLEEIWGDKPVKLKAAAVKGLPKASEPEPAQEKPAAKPARKAAAKPSAKAAKVAKAAEPEAPVAKPAAKKTASTTARKTTKPAAKPAAKTTAKPAAKAAPKPAAKPATKSAAKPAAKAATKPASKPAKPRAA